MERAMVFECINYGHVCLEKENRQVQRAIRRRKEK